MSKVVYLIGAGASYGERGRNSAGEIIPGKIERGLPVVNQLESSIEWFCGTIRKRNDLGAPINDSVYPHIYKELMWLKDKCHAYPTIDTYAKKLTVTKDLKELNRLKNALSLFFALLQNHQNRDLRYDGFIASIIQDDGSLPNNITVLSWNYDYQMEYVLQDFSSPDTDILQVWQKYGINCKGFNNNVLGSKFNYIKLNGTAMFSNARENKLVNPELYELERLERIYSDSFLQWCSNISFAWERDDNFIESILPILRDTTVLVVVGYSFPFVNRSVDKRLIQSMSRLRSVYIQDTVASDVKQSFETLLSFGQEQLIEQRALKIHLRTSVNQFFIPKELS